MHKAILARLALVGLALAILGVSGWLFVGTSVASPTRPDELCAPVFPSTYNGAVLVDGQPAADGTALTVVVDGVEWGSAPIADGRYVRDIPPGLPAHPPCFYGGTVTFAVGDAVCDQSPYWQSGLHDLDLTCG